MSQNGLRFTLDVDGLTPTATAVVSFTLYQNLSTRFFLSVDTRALKQASEASKQIIEAINN